MLCVPVASLSLLPVFLSIFSLLFTSFFQCIKSSAFTSYSVCLSLVPLLAQDLSGESQQTQYWWGNWERSSKSNKDLWRLWTCCYQTWLKTIWLQGHVPKFKQSFSLSHPNSYFRLELNQLNQHVLTVSSPHSSHMTKTLSALDMSFENNAATQFSLYGLIQ